MAQHDDQTTHGAHDEGQPACPNRQWTERLMWSTAHGDLAVCLKLELQEDGTPRLVGAAATPPTEGLSWTATVPAGRSLQEAAEAARAAELERIAAERGVEPVKLERLIEEVPEDGVTADPILMHSKAVEGMHRLLDTAEEEAAWSEEYDRLQAMERVVGVARRVCSWAAHRGVVGPGFSALLAQMGAELLLVPEGELTKVAREAREAADSMREDVRTGRTLPGMPGNAPLAAEEPLPVKPADWTEEEWRKKLGMVERMDRIARAAGAFVDKVIGAELSPSGNELRTPAGEPFASELALLVEAVRPDYRLDPRVMADRWHVRRQKADRLARLTRTAKRFVACLTSVERLSRDGTSLRVSAGRGDFPEALLDLIRAAQNAGGSVYLPEEYGAALTEKTPPPPVKPNPRDVLADALQADMPLTVAMLAWVLGLEDPEERAKRKAGRQSGKTTAGLLRALVIAHNEGRATAVCANFVHSRSMESKLRRMCESAGLPWEELKPRISLIWTEGNHDPRPEVLVL